MSRLTGGPTEFEEIRVIPPPGSTDECHVLEDAATILTDATLGNLFTVTIAANRILGNPTDAYCGQPLVWRITQGAGGSHGLTYDTKFRFGATVPNATLSTVEGKTDYLGAFYNAASDTFDVVAFVKGY